MGLEMSRECLELECLEKLELMMSRMQNMRKNDTRDVIYAEFWAGSAYIDLKSNGAQDARQAVFEDFFCNLHNIMSCHYVRNTQLRNLIIYIFFCSCIIA